MKNEDNIADSHLGNIKKLLVFGFSKKWKNLIIFSYHKFYVSHIKR